MRYQIVSIPTAKKIFYHIIERNSGKVKAFACTYIQASCIANRLEMQGAVAA